MNHALTRDQAASRPDRGDQAQTRAVDPDAPPGRFVILAAPRSGSNMLCTMLDSHPSILCHHEIYNPKGIRLALSLRGTDFSLGSVAERDGDPEAFLERVWAAPPNRSRVGFKLTHRQNERIYHRVLSDVGIAKIVLDRRNRLKRYVSNLIALALAEWEVYRREDLKPNRPKVLVDPESFLESVAFDDAYHDEIHAAIAGRGHSWAQVFYEELFAVGEHGVILRFLGVEPASTGLKIGGLKQNSADLRDLIENYDELERAFAGTPYEAELHDRDW